MMMKEPGGFKTHSKTKLKNSLFLCTLHGVYEVLFVTVHVISCSDSRVIAFPRYRLFSVDSLLLTTS